MRFLYLDWPHLAHRIEAARAQLDELVVIGGQPWEQGAVLDCSPATRKLGVARGQPLGTAHRLVPEAQFLPADRATYRGEKLGLRNERSEEHTSELQSQSNLVCRLLLEKKKKKNKITKPTKITY